MQIYEPDCLFLQLAVSYQYLEKDSVMEEIYTKRFIQVPMCRSLWTQKSQNINNCIHPQMALKESWIVQAGCKIKAAHN